MPERAATLAELRAVREQLHDLTVTLDRQVDARVDAKVAEVDPVPREEFQRSRDDFQRRIRRSGLRVAVTIAVVLAVAAIGIGLNRATLTQAQRQAEADIRHVIATCRVSAPAMSDADQRFCDRRFPGFTEARANQVKVVAAARRNEQRLEHLEAEVAKLKE